MCFRKSLAHSRKTQLPKGSHRRAGMACPRVKPGFRQCGRFRRQQRIARFCAGSYRHVLILFVHIDGRTRPFVFPQIVSSLPQNSTTEGSLGNRSSGVHPASTIAAATRDILRAIMCRSPLCHAVITARRTEFGCRFSSSGVMSSRVLPSVQWRACSRALSARMTTTQRPILCHLCHLVPLCHPV